MQSAFNSYVQLFAFALLVSLGTAHAQMPSPIRNPNQLPMELRRFIVDLHKQCQEFGGKPGKSPKLVTFADLTGDGVLDYVIDVHNYECSDTSAEAMLNGQSGGTIVIFVGGANNTATKAFTESVYGSNIDQASGKARIYLDVAAANCGQRNAANVPFSDWKFCSRPLDWDAAKGSFKFAPLAQARKTQ
jgi:hypothetical protein